MNPYNYSNYLFILAHPDDEVYSCVFISKLIKLGKVVNILYVTSGDYSGADVAVERKKEVYDSMEVIGLDKEQVHYLDIPERELMDRVFEVCNLLDSRVQQIDPDCIVGHDFEGGHNGHDAVSFCASFIANKIEVPLFVFPAYHGWPKKRVFNTFINERERDYIIDFTDEDRHLQKKVISSHQTQQKFFKGIEDSASSDIFSKREILRFVSNPIDYTSPPDNPVGYEYPGSNLLFEEFRKIILEIIKRY